MRAMKDSGIAWIGEIPQTWTIDKIKHHFTIVSGATPKSEISAYWDGDIPWVTPADYKTQDKFVSQGRKSLTQEGYDACGTTLIPEGSLVFSKRAPVGTVAIAKNELCTNQGCLSCVAKDNVNSEYYYYALSTFTEQFDLVSTGTTFKEIAADVFANFYLPHPDYKEQRIIASFLNSECARIDAVMEQTRASIEEYKKLKQAVITQAVTKGIRHNRPMKDSGVDWIGEIPVDWEMLRKLSYACCKNISYGIVKLFDPDDEHGVKVLRCSDIREGIIDTSNIRTVTQEISNEYSRTILDGGEVLINVRGTLGGCAVVPKEMKGYNIAREVAMVSTNNTLNNRYLMYYFLSNAFLTYEEMNLAGSVYIGLNIELLSACPVLLPSILEQVEIANYLDSKCFEINALIAKKECFFQELEKYKKSMVFEYVTGKKGV